MVCLKKRALNSIDKKGKHMGRIIHKRWTGSKVSDADLAMVTAMDKI